MKILHIHPSLASGGIEAMICALANEMSKQHEVTVCSIFTPKDNHIFWHKLNYKVQRETIGKQTKGFSINEIFKILALTSLFLFFDKRDQDNAKMHLEMISKDFINQDRYCLC